MTGFCNLLCGRQAGRGLVAGVTLAFGGVLLLQSTPVMAAAKKAATRVTADYTITYSGVKIGTFQFKSSVVGRRYELTSNSWVKIFFGAFKWNSQSTSRGVLSQKPQPQSFQFSYEIKKKRKTAAVQFARGNVVSLTNTPRINYTNKHVPIRPEHLVGVLDPMSAIMQMSRVSKGNPCNQTAEVFDGTRRLRLTLSPKGRRRIEERHPSGQPAFGYVCRIRFTPIAGHKKSSQINYLARNKNMEIVLRPVPAANMVVPYEILVPTMVGTVSVSARSITIDDERAQRIAMTR